MQNHLAVPPVPAPTTRAFRDEGAWPARGGLVLHQLVALAVLATLTTALFVLPRALRRNQPWARWAVPTRLAGLAALLALVALLSGTTGDLGGLVQRAFTVLVFGWPVLLAAVPGRTTLP